MCCKFEFFYSANLVPIVVFLYHKYCKVLLLLSVDKLCVVYLKKLL